MTRYVLIPTTMLLCGCVFSRKPVAPEPARVPARDSLFRFDRTRSDSAAKSRDGSLATFAPNVAYLRAGASTIYGRDAVARAVSTADAEQTSITWEPLGGGVSDDLQSAYTYGVAARTTKTATAAKLGRYLAYWQRSRANAWQIVAYVDLSAASFPANLPIGETAVTPPAEPSLPKPLADARTSLRSADSSFSDLSYRMGTGYAFTNTVAEDGVIFGASELRIGPRAIRESFELQTEASSLTWKPVYASIAASGDLGYTIGEYVSTGRGTTSSAVVQRFGKYLTVWRRQKNGSWLFVADGGNPSPTPPTR